MGVRFFFAWFDFWVGWYYDRFKHILYLCPVPCCVIAIQFPVDHQYFDLAPVYKLVAYHVPGPEIAEGDFPDTDFAEYESDLKYIESDEYKNELKTYPTKSLVAYYGIEAGHAMLRFAQKRPLMGTLNAFKREKMLKEILDRIEICRQATIKE